MKAESIAVWLNEASWWLRRGDRAMTALCLGMAAQAAREALVTGRGEAVTQWARMALPVAA